MFFFPTVALISLVIPPARNLAGTSQHCWRLTSRWALSWWAGQSWTSCPRMRSCLLLLLLVSAQALATRSNRLKFRSWKGLGNDKKGNKTFHIYKEIQMGSGAKSYMRKGFLIYDEMRKFFPIYEEDVSHTVSDFAPDPSYFPNIWGKFLFSFYQCIFAWFIFTVLIGVTSMTCLG